MTVDLGPAPSEAILRRFSQPEALSSALLGGQVDYLRLSKARFAASLGVLRVGDLVIQHVVDGPHLARGAMVEGIVAVLIPLGYAGDPARMNGVTLPTTGAFILPGGAEFHGHCPGDTTWASLAVSHAALESWTDGAPLPFQAGAGPCVAHLAAGPGGRLADALSATGMMVQHLPAVLATAQCADSLAKSMRELVAAALMSGCFTEQSRTGKREAYRIVRKADEYLRDNVSRPIYHEELCAVLGASMRKMHSAFVTVVGMSPHRYLRLRRLSLVHRALHAAKGAALVKSIALSHGFWHLGRFAHDYRELFGEFPSEMQRPGNADADPCRIWSTGP